MTSTAPSEDRPARVLVVDDDAAVCRAIVLTVRKHGYEAEAVTSAAAALERLYAASWDLMLCDVRMPNVSGLDLLRRARSIDQNLAVVMLTGVLDAATATTAMRGGALDYVTKPFHATELCAAIDQALRTRRLRVEQQRVERLVREEVGARTEELRQRTAELEERTAQLEREQRALEGLTVAVAESLITAMEAKDVYLRGHSHRVAALAAAMADALGAGAEEVEAVRLAGRLHDVGKIGIRETILNKPAALTPEEYAHVQEHVRIGMDILAPLTHLGDVLTFVHHHHERWDGSGYPQGLAGEHISLGGRILAAADSYDALTSARAYRAPRSSDDALAVLEHGRGSLLDPRALEALVQVVRRRQSLPFLDVH